MKIKALLLILLVLVLVGCNKNTTPNENASNNNQSIQTKNETLIDIIPIYNETTLEDIVVNDEKIKLSDDTLEAKEALVNIYVDALGKEVYNRKIYKNYSKEGSKYKVYVSDLKKSNYNVSKIEELCNKLCSISDIYFLIDENNSDAPFSATIDFHDTEYYPGTTVIEKGQK